MSATLGSSIFFCLCSGSFQFRIKAGCSRRARIARRLPPPGRHPSDRRPRVAAERGSGTVRAQSERIESRVQRSRSAQYDARPSPAITASRPRRHPQAMDARTSSGKGLQGFEAVITTGNTAAADAVIAAIAVYVREVRWRRLRVRGQTRS